MRVDRLQRIKRHILEEPLRVNMEPLLCKPDLQKAARGYFGAKRRTLPYDHPPTWPACKTVACIAGWEIALYGDPVEDFAEAARERLELPNDSLFYAAGWPDALRESLFAEDPGTANYAKVVADAIEDYIRTGGWSDQGSSTSEEARS